MKKKEDNPHEVVNEQTSVGFNPSRTFGGEKNKAGMYPFKDFDNPTEPQKNLTRPEFSVKDDQFKKVSMNQTITTEL